MRNMRKDVFQSVFADEIRNYINAKVVLGFKEASYYYQMKEFDIFCSARGLDRIALSREDADVWIIRNAGEGDRGYCNRVCVVKNFLIYLNQLGYDVFATRNIKYSVSDFKPHIYSDDEVSRYFAAIDSYETSKARMNAIQFPILFRIFHCCGTRLHETLCIRVKDVDFREGTIRLNETKNHTERLVALGDDLKELMISFADKSFYLLKDSDYIFTSSRGSHYSNDRIYTVHRYALEKAEIPYVGDREGPRIHDWRHTFAVRSFKQMIDAGMDMYTALPILSTYLGHKSIYATERYLRLTMSVYPYIEENAGSRWMIYLGWRRAMKRTDFAFYLSKFLVEYMPGAKGSSPQTIDSYRYGFIRFLDFLHEVKSLPADRVAISDLTYENVRDFLGWLQDVRHNSISTRNQRQAALNSFVKFLMYEYPDYLNEYQRILAIPVKKYLKPEIAFLKSSGVKLLIGQPDTETRTGTRDYAILATLFTTGIRVSELTGLRVKDISPLDPCTMLVHGKGNKCRYVQITKYLAPIINRYLLENGYDRPEKMNEWLFLNHMGHKFTRQGINYLVKKYSTMAQKVSPELISDGFSPHKMRHSAAMSLLEAGVDLIYIRDLLGHVSVKTTEIYIRTDAKLKREVIEAASMEIVPKEAAKWENDDALKDWLKNFGKRR